MGETDEASFYSVDDLPPVNDPARAERTYGEIMARHVLATLRRDAGMTQVDVAEVRGVTKAAIHQLENRPLAKVSIGSLLAYLQALGYAVDEEWIAQTIAGALPACDGEVEVV